MKKIIMAVAVVCAAFAMTSCNKCTECKVSATIAGVSVDVPFSAENGLNADDCKELKKAVKEYVDQMNASGNGTYSFHCN